MTRFSSNVKYVLYIWNKCGIYRVKSLTVSLCDAFMSLQWMINSLHTEATSCYIILSLNKILRCLMFICYNLDILSHSCIMVTCRYD